MAFFSARCRLTALSLSEQHPCLDGAFPVWTAPKRAVSIDVSSANFRAKSTCRARIQCEIPICRCSNIFWAGPQPDFRTTHVCLPLFYPSLASRLALLGQFSASFGFWGGFEGDLRQIICRKRPRTYMGHWEFLHGMLPKPRSSNF